MKVDIKDIELFIDFCRAPYNFEHKSEEKSYKELSDKIEHLIKAYKELEEDNSLLIQQNITYKRNIHDLKHNNIPISLVKEKIEEYFEDEEWLVEHDLRALCDDEKECREYYTNKKIALKDIKKAILDKLNKLLKNY